MDLKDLPPPELCYRLDKMFPSYWFEYSGTAGNLTALVMRCGDNKTTFVAKFEIDEDNSLEYVLTKILLQFSDGMVNA